VIVKVGGSVAENLEVVVDTLGLLKVVHIIPGGWVFADLVREIDREKKFHPSVSHWMAVLSMSIYGFYIFGIAEKRGFEIYEPEDFSLPEKRTVLLPYRLLRKYDELPHSWEVTSDSIAVWVAARAGFDEVVKVTAGRILRNGEVVEKVKASELETDVVDKLTPKLLTKYGINMFVCNPEELKNYILRGRANGTLIVGR